MAQMVLHNSNLTQLTTTDRLTPPGVLASIPTRQDNKVLLSTGKHSLVVRLIACCASIPLSPNRAIIPLIRVRLTYRFLIGRWMWTPFSI